ncbi:MAG: 16S rRNA (guanine(527)-N(7))-methyltransferase RsmG [Proteobacteria bacterium]|nr:16S rRNA (guanine(527)-N(7))-methyltransferase RsmG [Pseudomonadota bacterium]
MVADTQRLGQLITSAGVSLDSVGLAKLIEYRDLLLRWNQVTNLVSRKDIDRLEARHLVDSLTLVPWLNGERIADLGSGGGLPGIPLALASPERHFTLVERRERKARFLEQAKLDLGLANVEVFARDWQHMEHSFDTVVSRGVAGVEAVWKLVEPKLAMAGTLIVMSTTRDAATATVSLSGAASVREVAIDVPGMDHTHGIVVVIKQTDKRADGA